MGQSRASHIMSQKAKENKETRTLSRGPSHEVQPTEASLTFKGAGDTLGTEPAGCEPSSSHHVASREALLEAVF